MTIVGVSTWRCRSRSAKGRRPRPSTARTKLGWRSVTSSRAFCLRVDHEEIGCSVSPMWSELSAHRACLKEGRGRHVSLPGLSRSAGNLRRLYGDRLSLDRYAQSGSQAKRRRTLVPRFTLTKEGLPKRQPLSEVWSSPETRYVEQNAPGFKTTNDANSAPGRDDANRPTREAP